MLDKELKPFLAGSFAAHVVGAALLALIGPGGATRPDPVYTISFVGASKSIVNRTPGAAKIPPSALKRPPAARPKRPPPQTDPDAFNRSKLPRPLPKPRFLPGDDPAPKSAPAPAPLPEPALEEEAAVEEETTAAGGEDSRGGGPSLEALEMPNFPYPWYITRVRSAVWEGWAQRFSTGGGECGVMFTIMRDGSVVDLRIEFTSGESAFDYAATSAIQKAAPFPPLPPGFKKPFLKVHFEFRS